MAEMSTFLQIDLQTLFFEAKRSGHKIDFEKVWSHFQNREAEYLNEAIIYMIQSEDFDSSKFESKMLGVGYKIKYKKFAKNNRTFCKQPNHDINITVDAIDKIKYYDKLILMSGDNDFSDLGKYLRSKKKKIEIWGFEGGISSPIEAYADKINYLNDSFFYKKPNISVFGFNKDLDSTY